VVDDYLAESAGNSAAFLERLGQSAKADLVVLGEQDLETAMEQMALGLIPGGKLGGAAGRALKASASTIGTLVGRTSIHASTAAMHYAARGGAPRRGDRGSRHGYGYENGAQVQPESNELVG
jgi:hypothetical protein